MSRGSASAPAPDDPEAAEKLEAARLGRALRVLRLRCGLSREDAGARMGIGGEGWAKYERGQSAGIFRPSVRRRLAEALGFVVADLLAEAARVAAVADAEESRRVADLLDACPPDDGTVKINVLPEPAP
jgi:transcriptional regulator with XRE-family HTH domain